MKNILTLLLFLTLLNNNLIAQRWPFELWHEGKIVLETGDTLKGNVKYDLAQDLLQYSSTKKIAEAYTARKVVFFEIFDQTVRKYRQFFSLPYSANNTYKTPVFFELLAEGKLTLLCREAIEFRTYNNPYFVGSYSRQVLVNYFFFLDEKGNINAFSGRRSDLLNLMQKRRDEVEKYMKKNRLTIDEKYEMAQIVSYFNTL
ncbi:MAG: hypothetical protein O9302_07110 [Cyclobacteriaceae bacterium]|nr:hypothetical protein [Cytophagales bacterium]MCZ8327810.1 hypothetical protein [Cyclobacteriaceae bacterium]